MANVINTTKLEKYLSQRWTEFIDKTQLMRTILEHVRDSTYRTSNTKPPTKSNNRVSVSFHPSSAENYELEMWAEFIVPKNEGTVIGTHIFSISSNGEIKLKETYGTHFC